MPEGSSPHNLTKCLQTFCNSNQASSRCILIVCLLTLYTPLLSSNPCTNTINNLFTIFLTSLTHYTSSHSLLSSIYIPLPICNPIFTFPRRRTPYHVLSSQTHSIHNNTVPSIFYVVCVSFVSSFFFFTWF